MGISLNLLGYPCCRDVIKKENKRDSLIKEYTKYIGIKEATGNNDGDVVEMFLSVAGLGAGYAWCAAFVAYCHREVNVHYPSSPAWSPSWFPKNNIIEKNSALRGDVFGLYYSNLKRIGHVGFLDEDWDDKSSTILTVEGNTNSDGVREGDGVYRKRRNKKQIHKISRWL